MIRSLMSLLFATTLALAALGFSPDAKAQGIEQKLDDAFNTMSNYTPPSVSHNARRGVISGGSLSIRTPVVNIRPFALRGPSVSVGCGGIDAYFGAFSFISKEQLTQAMRAIVTAAITYAFQLALEAMCPTCADILAKVQEWLAKANEFLTNSCEATRNFMDDKQISNSIYNTAYNWRTGSGSSEDHFAARNQGSSTAPTKAAEGESGGQVFQELPAKGNQIWQVLKKTADASFGFDSNQFLEEMMSLTGTIIVCMPDDDKCAQVGKDAGGKHYGQNGELQMWRKPPLMRLADLVKGGGAETKIYKCDGDATKCEKLVVYANPVVGMATQIRHAYNGIPASNGASPGILWKVRYNYLTAPTAEEEKWLRVGGSLSAMALRLAQKDLEMARGYIDDNAEGIAAEIILDYISKNMLGANVAFGRSSQDGLSEGYKMLMEAQDSIREEAKQFFANSERKMSMYEAYLARMELQR